jgi:hypothetical protein
MSEETEIKCRGCGGVGYTTTSQHMEPRGGFSQSEWAELDYEFQDDYMSGGCDKRVPCKACKSTGKETVVEQTACVICKNNFSQTQLTGMRERRQMWDPQPCWENETCIQTYVRREAEEAGMNCRCGRCAWCIS